jgi:hypothetical protein
MPAGELAWKEVGMLQDLESVSASVLASVASVGKILKSFCYTGVRTNGANVSSKMTRGSRVNGLYLLFD